MPAVCSAAHGSARCLQASKLQLICPALRTCPVQVDIQHAPTDYQLLGACITAVNAAGKPALVRVEGPHDRGGIQQVDAWA